MFELYSNVRIYIRDFFTSTLILFKSENLIFYWEGGWLVCAERDVTEEGSRKQT